MGSYSNASCDCGFRRSVCIGGSRSDFTTTSTFPFFCESCGLVMVNVAKETLECPQCKSTDVKPYGKPPVSLPRGQQDTEAISWWKYGACSDGNLCPACRKMTLRFERGGLRFD